MSEISDMEIFSRVVSAGGLSAAGRDLGLSPAVVSKRLRRLEERLGTRLLQRTTRQISLTEAGKGYHERVVAILAGIEEAEAFVTRRSVQPRGTLRISAPTSFGRMHVAPHLHDFMQANLDLRISLDLTDSFVDIVGEGFDLALRIGQLEDSSLVARKLAPIRRVLCATPDYISRHGEPRDIETLDPEACLATRSQTPWRLVGPQGEVTVRTGSRLQTNSNEVVREALLSGAGIALRSTWDVSEELADGRLRIVLPQYTNPADTGLYAVFPSRRFLPAKVRGFIDYLCKVYGSVPYWETAIEGANEALEAAQ